jgi:hypothetical protein
LSSLYAPLRSAPARICVFGTHSATWISKGWLKTALLYSTALPEGEDIPGDFAGSHVPGARERLWCYSQVGLAKQYYVAAAPEAEVRHQQRGRLECLQLAGRAKGSSSCTRPQFARTCSYNSRLPSAKKRVNQRRWAERLPPPQKGSGWVRRRAAPHCL